MLKKCAQQDGQNQFERSNRSLRVTVRDGIQHVTAPIPAPSTSLKHPWQSQQRHVYSCSDLDHGAQQHHPLRHLGHRVGTKVEGAIGRVEFKAVRVSPASAAATDNGPHVQHAVHADHARRLLLTILRTDATIALSVTTDDDVCDATAIERVGRQCSGLNIPTPTLFFVLLMEEKDETHDYKQQQEQEQQL